MNKETTFTKIVERTSKLDAYEQAIQLIEKFGLDYGLKALKEKAENHRVFVSAQPLAYDFSTQSLGPHFEYSVTVTVAEDQP